MKKNKYETLFNISSVIFILFVGGFFISRMIYFNLESKKEIKKSNILSQYIVDNINKYDINTKLIYLNNEYIYTGDSLDNYIKYNGYLWRIIKINKDKSITMITDDVISSLSYNKILEYLNKSDNNYSGIFEDSIKDNILINNKLCINKIEDTSDTGCFETTNDLKIGILSLNDYMNAGTNKSYLNNGEHFWLSNGNSDNKYWYITDEGLLSLDNMNDKHGIRPVITIKKDIKFYSGDGTYDKPYIIEQRNINTTSDIYPGEYLNYNNETWKVVSTNNNIKIVNTDKLKIKDDYYKTIFSNKNNVVNNNNQLIKYLNTTYYKTLSNKEYLTKGIFYTGNYSLKTNNYQDCYKKYINNYVGFLSLGELFINEIEQVLTMTPSSTNDLSIFSINDNKQPFENTIDNKNYIRISLYLNKNIEITDGDGSINNPYILGEIK